MCAALFTFHFFALKFLKSIHALLSSPPLTESSWERPAELPVRSEEAAGSGSSREAKGQEDPSPPKPEPLSGGEDSSNGVKAAKEAGGDGQDSEQSNAPKISFRVRRLEQ